MRTRALSVLLFIVASMIFASHYWFAPSIAPRRIFKPHKPRLMSTLSKLEQRAATVVTQLEQTVADNLRGAADALDPLGNEDDADEGEDGGDDGVDLGADDEAAEDEGEAGAEWVDSDDDDDNEDDEDDEGEDDTEDTALDDEVDKEMGEQEEQAGDASQPMLAAAAIAAGGLEPYPSAEVEFQCKPAETPRPTRPLDHVVSPEAAEWPTNCVGREELCEVVKKTAIGREVMVAVCNSGITGQLAKWVESNRRAKISNMMIVAIDKKITEWLSANGVAYWQRTTSAYGSHKISAQKFGFVKEFLTIGCSVLMSDIDVVYLQNPFLFLHKDSDIEGTTDGWDDGSAYGWTERLDDPSMGAFGRFRPSMRITAWNSGLWYARATHASLRLMTILAHRMSTEDKTWDQAAFGEEVARPARDDHLAAGITKRALNHWCFANSKTIFRRVRVEPRFAKHVPVVVHANYHQPKEPRMRAVYDRWHGGIADALDRFRGEQAFTVPAPELERDFMHVINDGFVSGSNSRDASLATSKHGCEPIASKHGLSLSLHTLPVAACASNARVCAAAAAAASSSVPQGRGGAPLEEVMLVVGGSAQLGELKLLLESARRASVTNLLLVLTDAAAADALGALGENAPKPAPTDAAAAGGGPLYLVKEVAAEEGALGTALAKFAAAEEVLRSGRGVLVASAATVILSNPFKSLYRDADIEAMSLGWDDGSAYGYNHVLDDPSMGFTRFCHGSRIVGYEPNFFYGSPTAEAVALAVRMRAQLRRQLGASSAPAEVSEVERETFVRELWRPSHHEFAAVGAVLRVMNYLCFVNSKVMFRQLRNAANNPTRPVAVQLDYHSDAVPRMQALIAAYFEQKRDELSKLPLADSAAASGSDAANGAAAAAASCTRSRRGADGLAAALVAQLIEKSPFAWGGMGDLNFKQDGVLSTPWGNGSWGALDGGGGAATTFYADFVGAKHNVEVLPSGLAISTRCSDRNVVLVRSIKAAKAAAAKNK